MSEKLKNDPHLPSASKHFFTHSMSAAAIRAI
jgi:hypothetical protein